MATGSVEPESQPNGTGLVGAIGPIQSIDSDTLVELFSLQRPPVWPFQFCPA